MREIKFRVWIDGNWADWLPCIKTFGCYNEIGIHDGDSATVEEYSVEQYTGLKDKNGKEIYEGDIIQEEIDFNSKMTDGVFKYKVYWDEEELCWCLEHIGNESIHHELWQCNQSTEVIGNIHENPELLGKEK